MSTKRQWEIENYYSTKHHSFIDIEKLHYMKLSNVYALGDN